MSIDSPDSTSAAITRRRLLCTAASGGMALAASALLPGAALAAGAGSLAPYKRLTRLSLNAPQAKALSYVEDATKVKHRLYRRGDDCANCHFYKGIQGKDYGPCALFPQNVVAAKGWCSAWAKQVK